ncbi:response regulator transcription factor [bacterium]|nr:response regulator transcription factor [bacterium]
MHQTETSSVLQIILADDDPAVIHTFAPPLEGAGYAVTICTSGLALQRLLAQQVSNFAAVISDLWDMGSPEARFIPERDLPRLMQHYPDLPFLILSAESYQVQQYEDAGMYAYVLKTDGPLALVKALAHTIVQRGQPIGERLVFYSPSIEMRYRLSRQERQVLRGIAQGMSTQELAQWLTLSPKTVETYRTRLMQKFRTHEDEPMNVAKMLTIALHEGLILSTDGHRSPRTRSDYPR